ncbi:hypothetical protein [Shinella zoogloeoides]
MSGRTSTPGQVTLTLTDREILVSSMAVAHATMYCTNAQIKILGVPGKEKEYQYYERWWAAYWSLQSKLRTYLPEAGTEVTA